METGQENEGVVAIVALTLFAGNYDLSEIDFLCSKSNEFKRLFESYIATMGDTYTGFFKAYPLMGAATQKLVLEKALERFGDEAKGRVNGRQ